MMMLNDLSMSYGQKLLFYDINLNLNSNTRYALVGANGCGKSTLFKLLTREEEPLSGSISFPKDAVIGWLKQDQYRYEEVLITDVVIQGKPLLWQAMQEKEKLLSSGEWTDRMANRLGHLEETIAHYNGYSAHALAEKLLIGLGVHKEYHHQPLKALSGGYKLRVLLAQSLFQQPDILLLDEPTNHLDIISIAWLEKYLINEFSGLLVFISHDMEFINRLADNILDIDYGEIRQYSGNYTKFLAEKALIEEQKLSLKKGLEKRVADMQSFVDRFKAKASKARQAQSRMKMIEKIELPDIKQSSRRAPNLKFIPKKASGKHLLKVQNLTKVYQGQPIFTELKFAVERGEKIAIIGENGVGKSTLIKVLLGKTAHEGGDFEWGHEAHISYFSQDHHDLLTESTSVLSWMLARVSNVSEQQVRKTLAYVLFSQDETKKNILSLSGGEAARLLLAEMMLESGNVLILDEPTNHLDIESADALAAALADFAGTLLLVSHNRYFIEKIANRILFISKKYGLIDFKGRYSEFEREYADFW